MFGFKKLERDLSLFRWDYPSHKYYGNCKYGIGKLVTTHNEIFEGEFMDYRLHGKGIFINNLGIKKYEGEWKNGLYRGKGNLFGSDKICRGLVSNNGNQIKFYSLKHFNYIEPTIHHFPSYQYKANENKYALSDEWFDTPYKLIKLCIKVIKKNNLKIPENIIRSQRLQIYLKN